ncbi:hypothetical protein CBER1_03759 [Cercospora berteroae]|uniref:NAD(P)-binding protein n=1 Tax=Cercospora berteroae TaxID=357750 RepID=A0A2S6C852_9PEZI|nr:hypothetical protein CBER1_03759 [Cercospora berteroae]
MASPVYTLTEATAKPPQNSIILITGAASGIGLATAVYLHKPEYKNNIIALDKSPKPPAISELTSSSRFLYISCDVLSWTSQRDAFASGAKKFGGIDHVFVNAGVAEYGEQIWTDHYDEKGELAEPNRICIDVDIRAVGDTLKLAMYHLRNDSEPGKQKGSGKGRGGTIVMTASLAGYLASAGAPLYSAAKHGVVGYLRALKGDCAKTGIAISVIAPGITTTPILSGVQPGQTLEDWSEKMSARGVPINTPHSIGLTVANLMGQGQKSNGQGVLIQGNKMQELEGGIAKNRDIWMGKEMLELFRGGRNAPLFPNKL